MVRMFLEKRFDSFALTHGSPSRSVVVDEIDLVIERPQQVLGGDAACSGAQLTYRGAEFRGAWRAREHRHEEFRGQLIIGESEILDQQAGGGAVGFGAADD